MKLTIILWLLLLAIHPTRAGQQVLYGKVIRVIDGDTFDLLSPGNTVRRIRLLDIDTPERGQDHYRVSKQALANMISAKHVRVTWSKTDRNGRILGTVFSDGVNVNLYMVESGYAWHFVRYSTDQQFARAEQRARAAKRGLWGMPHPEAPWEYRKRRK